MKYLTSSILALVGMAIVAPMANAQVSYTAGDLLVGFRSTTSNNDYVIDLGNYSQFASGGQYATGGAVTVVSGPNFTADLSSAGLTAGTFGVFGGINTSPNFALFGTETESAPGVQTSGQKPPTTFGFGTPYSKIASAGSQFNVGTDPVNTPPNQTAGSYTNSVIQHITADSNPNVAPNNYSSYLQPANAFQYFNTPYEGNYTTTTPSDVLDLYQFNRGAAASNLLGEFQINNGALLFDSASPATAAFPLTAVPGPATLAFGLAMIGACTIRRRVRSAVVA